MEEGTGGAATSTVVHRRWDGDKENPKFADSRHVLAEEVP